MPYASAEKRRAHYAANAERFRAQKRASIARDPSGNRASSKRHYEANAEEINRRRRAQKYGLTVEQLSSLEAHQGRACAACRREDPGGRGGKLHVDHNHETGAVRGLLCHTCNLALGAVGESVEVLHALIAYLDQPPALLALSGDGGLPSGS